MRILCLLLLSSLVLRAEPPAPTDARARELMATLKLEYLPGESGYFGLLGRSALTVEQDGRKLAAQSRIYYLLTAEAPINHLHWLASDDTHVLLEGGPVDYFIFNPDGSVGKITLGRDLAAGQQLVAAIPAGCWKALRLHPGAGYVLLANVLSPEWTPDRVKIGTGPDFMAKFTGAAPWATAGFLRQLNGPAATP